MYASLHKLLPVVCPQ